MNNINYLATEIRVAALDTSEMVIREFHRGQFWYFILMSKGKQIAGVEFLPSDTEGWWMLNSLFSDSTSGTMVLLFSALSKVKKILPSLHISPAASAVVSGIYKRYKNTEVVQPDILPDSWAGRDLPDYLRAGYVWSSKLRQIPIKE